MRNITILLFAISVLIIGITQGKSWTNFTYWCPKIVIEIKSFHFKKTAVQSSFLSKALSFSLKSKQSQRKWQRFWKKWELHSCLLKMNGLYFDSYFRTPIHEISSALTLSDSNNKNRNSKKKDCDIPHYSWSSCTKLSKWRTFLIQCWRSSEGFRDSAKFSCVVILL